MGTGIDGEGVGCHITAICKVFSPTNDLLIIPFTSPANEVEHPRYS